MAGIVINGTPCTEACHRARGTSCTCACEGACHGLGAEHPTSWVQLGLGFGFQRAPGVDPASAPLESEMEQPQPQPQPPTEEQLDEKSKPLRDAALSWLHVHGAGSASRYVKERHVWEIESSGLPRPLMIEVAEDASWVRINYGGAITGALSPAQVERALDRLLRS